MDLDQLQSVRDRERQTDKLQQLRESFYADAVEFIEDLRAERDEAAEAAEDPFGSPEVSRLSDRIQTAERTVEAIYEKRIGKLVKAATFAAADLPAEAEGMTTEEDDLFETLVADIKANRRRVLGPLQHTAAAEPEGAAAGGSPDEATPAEAGSDSTPSPPESLDQAGAPATEPPAESEPPADTTDGDSGVDAADVMGEGADGPTPGADADGDDHPSTESEESEEPDGAEDAGEDSDAPVSNDGGTTPEVERALVRITDDVGSILGVDEREYELSAEDVVTLPTANAEPLIERDAAERLE